VRTSKNALFLLPHNESQTVGRADHPRSSQLSWCCFERVPHQQTPVRIMVSLASGVLLDAVVSEQPDDGLGS
jgi:hypothetical protein